jgi:phage-related protein
VTRADLDAITRLVNEFRAELAALGVRTTAIEEELNAIKARLDNVMIKGGFRFRYDVGRASYGTGVGSTTPATSLNGNMRSSATDASALPITNRPRYEFKLGFDGSVTPDIHYVVALESIGFYNFFNSGQVGVPDDAFSAAGNCTVNTAGGNTGCNGGFGTIDTAFLDWRNAWGLPLEIMLGRFGANTPYGGGYYPIQWGPFGLLMNDNSDLWEDATASLGSNEADGLRIQTHVPAWADLQAEFAIIRIQGGNGSPFGNTIGGTISGGNYIFGDDAYGANANIQIIPGLRVGADYVANTITPSSPTAGPGGFGNAADWQLYGPGGGSVNPANQGGLSAGSYHCVPNFNNAGAGGVNALGLNFQGDTQNGIECPTLGTGWDGYIQWDIVPGIHFDGEYAQWNDAVFNTTDNGWQVNVHWDLGALTGIGHSFTADTGYKMFGQNFYAPYGAADLDYCCNDFLYPGNGSVWTAGLSFKPIDAVTLSGSGIWGNSTSNGQTLSEYDVSLTYAFIQNASITFRVREARIAGVEQFLLYRAQVDYSF